MSNAAATCFRLTTGAEKQAIRNFESYGPGGAMFLEAAAQHEMRPAES